MANALISFFFFVKLRFFFCRVLAEFFLSLCRVPSLSPILGCQVRVKSEFSNFDVNTSELKEPQTMPLVLALSCLLVASSSTSSVAR